MNILLIRSLWKRQSKQISLLVGIFFIFYFVNAKIFFAAKAKRNNLENILTETVKIISRTISPESNIKILPLVHSIVENGGRLILSNDFRFATNKKNPPKDLLFAIDRYRDYFTALTKLSSQRIDHVAEDFPNQIVLDCSSINFDEINEYPVLNEDEYYRLTVTESGATIETKSLTGILRGLATFIQIIDNNLDEKFYLPHVIIEDKPRFPWRGLMIDVCRHWIPFNVVQRTIDAMELSKFNVLHLHLSDDQAFRMESLQYPLLHDRKYYFTQKQMQELIEYARKRRIRVVPEFDIPGHTTSWFVGYPELTSEPGPYKVESKWGILQPTIDPSKESTYTFLTNFFEEMTNLFPDLYFHIGGDEVEGSQWKRSETIQEFAKKNNLKTKAELQAHFNLRVQKIFEKFSKKIVGWEEIMDEPNEKLSIKKDAIIHSWRGKRSLIDAVKSGYRAILSSSYYLDSLLPSHFYYKNDPLGETERLTLSEEERRRILGGEACMWTEYVSQDTIDSRIWPRALAVSERLWSPSTFKTIDSFYERLFRTSHLLDRLNLGLSHTFSSMNRRLHDLLPDFNQKEEMIWPLTILAQACEALGHPQRAHTGRYNSEVPLTTFVDTLVPESEFIWKLESGSMDNETLFPAFENWAVNHIRLRALFKNLDVMKQVQKKLVQNIENLSKNLAITGQIGLNLLYYQATGEFHPNKNDTINTWNSKQYYNHFLLLLQNLELQVPEVRLAAVRPVQHLLTKLF